MANGALGGNNLEGVSFDQRWKWNETIGPYVILVFIKSTPCMRADISGVGSKTDPDGLETGVRYHAEHVVW